MLASDINPDLWYAIAGSSTRIPSVNSDVYYFPDGHGENSPVNREIGERWPPLLCKVKSVRYLCTSSTDQAFIKFHLHPIDQTMRNNENIEKTDQTDIVNFSKILTTSDVNASDVKKSGGFPIPRFGAESIFPPLNLLDGPSVQTLMMFDAHQIKYAFRHIYCGTPRRHFLTSGWIKFVKRKRLVAGDSVIFMKKKSTGQLFIGIRRLSFAGGEGFSADQFMEGIQNSRNGAEFVVAYYPRMLMPDFVLGAEKVDESMRRGWDVGMRVKMVVPTEDSSRMAWFQGTIESVGNLKDNGSPWGVIQVSWDESEIRQIPTRVSPWQIEPAEPAQEEEHNSPFYPPSKKLKAPITITIPDDDDDDFSFPKLTQSASTHNWGTFQDSQFSVSMPGTSTDATDYHTGNSFWSFNQHLKSGLGAKPRPVSTELNLGSSSRIETSPPTGYSFKLFGQTIHTHARRNEE